MGFIKLTLEDDTKEGVSLLIQHRLPWLLLGLTGGILSMFLSSRFEGLLSRNIHLVFFIPVIVYMADAVGTQTQTIYVRNLGREKVDFYTYLFKEFFTGIALGSIFGSVLGFIAYLFFGSIATSLTVGLAMATGIATAPIVALIVANILQNIKTDPALGGGPFTTILQDLLSLLIYLTIASLILLR